jgi:hypothetical protein
MIEGIIPASPKEEAMANGGSRRGVKAHSKSSYGKIGKIPTGKGGSTRTSIGRAASAPKVGPKNSGANSAPYVDSFFSL